MGEIKKFGRNINQHEHDQNWTKLYYYKEEESNSKIKKIINLIKNIIKK